VSTVAQIHGLFAWALVLYFPTLSDCGEYSGHPSPANLAQLRGALAIGAMLGVAQSLLGIVLLVLGTTQQRHYLYGVSVIVALPLAQQLMPIARSRPLR
jgi:hypothetical protein